MSRHPRKAGSLMQAIVIMSIVAVAVSATFFSLDPLLHVRASRNVDRWTQVNLLGRALRAYREANDGALPPGIDRMEETVQVVGESAAPCDRVLCRGERIARPQCRTPGVARALEPFLSPLPMDPLHGTMEDTRYAVNVDRRGVIFVSACDEEPEDLEGKETPPRIYVVW